MFQRRKDFPAKNIFHIIPEDAFSPLALSDYSVGFRRFGEKVFDFSSGLQSVGHNLEWLSFLWMMKELDKPHERPILKKSVYFFYHIFTGVKVLT